MSSSFLLFARKCISWHVMHVYLESLTSSTNATENTAESDVIQYECSVAFSGSGKISPSIRWTSGGADVTDGFVTTPSSNSVDSVYTVTAGTSNIPPFQCEVYFPQTSVSGSDAAQNIPTYTDRRNFEEIVVTCKLFLHATLLLLFTAMTYVSKNVHCLSKLILVILAKKWIVV